MAGPATIGGRSDLRNDSLPRVVEGAASPHQFFIVIARTLDVESATGAEEKALGTRIAAYR